MRLLRTGFLHGQVIVFSGPFSKSPGQVLRVAVAWTDPMPQGLREIFCPQFKQANMMALA